MNSTLFNDFGSKLNATDFSNNGQINNMAMFSIVPLLVTSFTSILSEVMRDFRGIIIGLLTSLTGVVMYFVNIYLLRRYNGFNKVYVQIIINNKTGKILNEEAMPIIWYFNKIISDKHLEQSVLLKQEYITNSNNKRNKFSKPKTENHCSMNYNSMYFIPPDCNSVVEDNCKMDKEFILIPFADLEYIDNVERSGNMQNTDLNNHSINGNLDPNTKLCKKHVDVEITDGIYMNCLELKNRRGNMYMSNGDTELESHIIIKSRTKSTRELLDFIEKISNDYEEYCSGHKSNKIFVYNGSTINMIEQTIDRYQTFKNLFFDHKKQIIDDINLLCDHDHHTKFGIKRKLGYLFTGIQGSGKTCVVTAMAKKLNRNIIYVPISRLNSNRELEDIIYTRMYNGVKYNTNEVIFLFDEIDSIGKNKSLIKNDCDVKDNESPSTMIPNIVINNGNDFSNGMNLNNSSSATKDTKNLDTLNVGILLNILDGNTDQEGLIVVATANDITKLDPAIYRDGRLNHLKFEYFGRNNIIEMIEHYRETELSEELKAKIRDDRVVQSLKIKNTCIRSIRSDLSDEELIDLINNLN